MTDAPNEPAADGDVADEAPDNWEGLTDPDDSAETGTEDEPADDAEPDAVPDAEPEPEDDEPRRFIDPDTVE